MASETKGQFRNKMPGAPPDALTPRLNCSLHVDFFERKRNSPVHVQELHALIRIRLRPLERSSGEHV